MTTIAKTQVHRLVCLWCAELHTIGARCRCGEEMAALGDSGYICPCCHLVAYVGEHAPVSHGMCSEAYDRTLGDYEPFAESSTTRIDFSLPWYLKAFLAGAAAAGAVFALIMIWRRW